MTRNRQKNDFLPRSNLGRKAAMRDLKFTFFGTSHIATFVLDALKNEGLIPSLIVTAPDKPKGRGLALQASAVKEWAQGNKIDILQPEKLDSEFIQRLTTDYKPLTATICIVVDYGKILPKELLAIPRRGFLNLHPSLLPRMRGPSPIRSTILSDEKNTGVSIILVDREMDHGPIVAQKHSTVGVWPPHLAELEKILMCEGGALLAQILPQWVKGDIDAHEQNHDVATYSEKIEKEDGFLNLSDDAYKNLLKIRAFEGWPGTYAYFDRNGKKIRVGILTAHIENGSLIIDKVKPEGKKEMSYTDFLRSGAKPL